MARISGIDIPREKRVIASLQYIHGVGSKRADDICKDLKIDPSTRVNNLTNDEVAQIRNCLLYTSPSPRDATLSRMPSSA